MPIKVSLDWVEEPEDQPEDETLTNVGLGGLSFLSSHALLKDQKVRVSIPILNEDSSLVGKVVWCQSWGTRYEIGLQFDSPDEVFRLRMIEQVCHIEHYRQEVERNEGRILTSEEAAHEWISRYAGDFPAI